MLLSCPTFGQFTIQVASTPSYERSQQIAKRIPGAYVLQATIRDELYFRVRVGEFATEAEAEAHAKKLRASKHITEYFITKSEAQFTEFKNEQVSFQYPAGWTIIQKAANDLFILSPSKTSFISVTEREIPFPISPETFSHLLPAGTQITKQHDKAIEFTLTYEDQPYKGILILYTHGNTLTEITLLQPLTEDSLHQLILNTFKPRL